MAAIESLVSVDQVSKLTNLSTRSIWRMISEARTPAVVRIGRSVRFRASEIDLWIKHSCPTRKAFEAILKRLQAIEV